VDKQKKAAAIARAALGVFREAGFHRARMADIAIAADIGKGTLYEYFGDKADILRFLFDQYFEAFKEGALRALQQAGSPGARLLALVEFALDHVTEWEDHCAVYVDYFGAARVGDAKLFSLGEIYEVFGGMLRELIEQAQATGEIPGDADPTATAELLLSVYDGLVLHGVLAGRRVGREALRDAALRLLVRGLIASPG
jgi:TetR/AcrR family fatty acid metabolism transcriptional regulator